jgi:hypothetical protein
MRRTLIEPLGAEVGENIPRGSVVQRPGRGPLATNTSQTNPPLIALYELNGYQIMLTVPETRIGNAAGLATAMGRAFQTCQSWPVTSE